METRIEKIPPLHEVKPCPFCGSGREYIIAEQYETAVGLRWRIVCIHCLAKMDKGYCQTEWQALDAWNVRNGGEKDDH
jgi:hypothetical protein